MPVIVTEIWFFPLYEAKFVRIMLVPEIVQFMLDNEFNAYKAPDMTHLGKGLMVRT